MGLRGGGTVVYVTPQDHRYIDDPQRREEAGTPGILESVRAGLVFKLQQEVGVKTIEQREAGFIKRALTELADQPNIELLGNTQVPRLSIISFRIKHQDKDLHYNFVVALLNDLFGIQARGGCSCAGPYGHSILNMSMGQSKAIERELVAGEMIVRPGWTRLNFNYFISEATFTYILEALKLVAEHGWRLLPFYHFDKASGTWRFQSHSREYQACLSDFDIDYQTTTIGSQPRFNDSQLTHFVSEAKRVLLASHQDWERTDLRVSSGAEKVRWFTLPQTVTAELTELH